MTATRCCSTSWAGQHHFEGSHSATPHRRRGRPKGHRRLRGPHGEALDVRPSRCRPIHTDWSGSAGFTPPTTTCNGRNDSTTLRLVRIPPWNDCPRLPRAAAHELVLRGSIYGPGHVVAYNQRHGFHDGIDHATYGMPDGYPKRRATACRLDRHLRQRRLDHARQLLRDRRRHAQLRVFRNRCFNAPLGAMSPHRSSAAPSTSFATWSTTRLGPGEDPCRACRHLLSSTTPTWASSASSRRCRTCTCATISSSAPGHRAARSCRSTRSRTTLGSDYNGFRPRPRTRSTRSSGIRRRKAAPSTSRRRARCGASRRSPSISAQRVRIGNSRAVDYSVFVNAAAPDFTDPTRLVSPDARGLALAAALARRRRAARSCRESPTGSAGRAPDLGAYEQGAEPPHYGPRPRN